MLGLALAERGLIHDFLIRFGIRRLCTQRLLQEYEPSPALRQTKLAAQVSKLKASPIAIHTEQANEQHYELPPEFFELTLGPHLKYSAGYWPEAGTDLAGAEQAALAMTCERAQLENGQQILELGCGWGSLTLWMAEHYPAAQITAVSNSQLQREHIERLAVARSLSNIEVITCDINDLTLTKRFDRVVSVEMFEHVRNYEVLFRRIGGWLERDGRLFVHIFCHREVTYPFESDGSSNWMGRYFFTGGQMPAAGLFQHFDADLQIEDQWRVEGTHYERTANAWLENLDRHQKGVLQVLGDTYGGLQQAKLWAQRWRIFFMACAELFGYRGGSEWMVTHYRFRKRAES